MSKELHIEYRSDTLNGREVYVSFVRELPGITSFATSPEEAMDEVQEMVESLRESHPSRHDWGEVRRAAEEKQVDPPSLQVSSNDWQQTFAESGDRTDTKRAV